jgi:hypothetical protein
LCPCLLVYSELVGRKIGGGKKRVKQSEKKTKAECLFSVQLV